MAFEFYIESEDLSRYPPRRHCFVVEGMDDALFLDQLLLGLDRDSKSTCVLAAKGQDRLERYLRSLSKTHEFTSGDVEGICIMFDANGSVDGAQRRIHKALEAVNLAKPESGDVLHADGRRIGLYLFPGGGNNGNLEDLCIEMLGDDLRVEVAGSAIDGIRESGVELDQLSKRKMQVVLAASTPGLAAGAGRGIRNGAIELDLDRMPELRDFIERFLS